VKAVIGGGSGFIGRHLRNHLQGRGYQVTVLTRRPKADGQIAWDGKSLGAWIDTFEGADLVIDLAGEAIGSRMTRSKRQALRSSRIDSTRVFGEAIINCRRPPRVWVNASATGYYGDRDQEVLTESSTAGHDFLAQLCVDWEDAVAAHETPSTRKSIVRTGFVLGRDGGPLPTMSTAARYFAGGTLGNGGQWIPWIHVEDVAALIRWIGEEGGAGVYNGSNPNPARNEDFMRTLRHVLQRPWAPPVPAWVLKAARLASPVDPTLALVSSRAVPGRALSEGFRFRYSDLEAALTDLTCQTRTTKS
jgi:uncharacterized protein (TIGR01777 family)